MKKPERIPFTHFGMQGGGGAIPDIDETSGHLVEDATRQHNIDSDSTRDWSALLFFPGKKNLSRFFAASFPSIKHSGQKSGPEWTTACLLSLLFSGKGWTSASGLKQSQQCFAFFFCKQEDVDSASGWNSSSEWSSKRKAGTGTSGLKQSWQWSSGFRTKCIV